MDSNNEYCQRSGHGVTDVTEVIHGYSGPVGLRITKIESSCVIVTLPFGRPGEKIEVKGAFNNFDYPFL